MASEKNRALVLDPDDDEDHIFDEPPRDEDTFAATQDLLSTSRPDSFRLHLEASQWPSLTIDDDDKNEPHTSKCKRAVDDNKDGNGDKKSDDEMWKEKRPRLESDDKDASIVELKEDEKTNAADQSVVVIDSSIEEDKNDDKHESQTNDVSLDKESKTEDVVRVEDSEKKNGKEPKVTLSPSTISPVPKTGIISTVFNSQEDSKLVRSQEEPKMTSTPQEETYLSKTLSIKAPLKLILMEESQYSSIFVSPTLKSRCIRTYTCTDTELVNEICQTLDNSCSTSSQISLDDFGTKEPNKGRLSEMSRVTSSSGGYNGDVESTLTSGSSECNVKRDRLSINPDIDVKCPRRPKPAPLPSMRPKNLEIIDESDTTTSTTPPKPNSSKTKQPNFKIGDSLVVAGSFVFALYAQPSRSRYWPAHVVRRVVEEESLKDTDTEKEETDEEKVAHFEIKYIEDSIVSTLPISSLIPATSLVAGDEVTVPLKADPGHTVKATLVNVVVNNDNVEYTLNFNPSQQSVARNPDTQVVKFEETLLDEQQCKRVRQHLGGPWVRDCKPLVVGGDIDLNNVIGSSRRIKRSTTSTPSKDLSKSASTSSNRKSNKKGGGFVETSENDIIEDQSTPRSSRKARGRGASESGTKSRGKGSRQKLFSSNKKKRAASERRSDLFAGLNFLVTQAKQPPENDDKEFLARLEEESTDEDDFDNHHVSKYFNKNALSSLIRSHGGTVLSTLPTSCPFHPSSTYVISNRHCRTLTYLVGLTFGLSRISFEWIQHSVDKGELRPLIDYVLPNGVIDKELIEPKMSCEQTLASSNLLKDRKLLLSSTSEDFLKAWEQLLSRMGASVWSRSRGGIDTNVGSIDMVIVDLDGAPIKVLEDAKSRNICVVNTKWVIESLICSELRPTKDYRVGV